MALKTGDQLELVVKSHGSGCRVRVNGRDLDNCRAFKLEASVQKATVLTVESYVPGYGDVYTYSGFFVDEDDMPAFLDWLRQRGRDVQVRDRTEEAHRA